MQHRRTSQDAVEKAGSQSTYPQDIVAFSVRPTRQQETATHTLGLGTSQHR